MVGAQGSLLSETLCGLQSLWDTPNMGQLEGWRKGHWCQGTFFRGGPGVCEWGQLGPSLPGLWSQLYPSLASLTLGPMLRRNLCSA